MEQPEFLRLVADALEQGGAPYALAGSFVSMAYGEPRLTRAVADLVDRDYVEKWAGELGVADIWQAILTRLGQGR